MCAYEHNYIIYIYIYIYYARTMKIQYDDIQYSTLNLIQN